MNHGKDEGTSRTWFSTTLGNVVTLINGRAYKQEEMLTQGTPILRIQNLNGGDRWFYSSLQLPSEKYCESGDLLYAWSATFGPYLYEGPRAIFHYHIWNVLPSAGIDKRFAFYELLRVTDQIKRSAHGVAMPHVTKGGMEAWPIELPPLVEQKRIADELQRIGIDEGLYVPLGQMAVPTVYSTKLSGLVRAPAFVFWNVGRAP